MLKHMHSSRKFKELSLKMATNLYNNMLNSSSVTLCGCLIQHSLSYSYPSTNAVFHSSNISHVHTTILCPILLLLTLYHGYINYIISLLNILENSLFYLNLDSKTILRLTMAGNSSLLHDNYL